MKMWKYEKFHLKISAREKLSCYYHNFFPLTNLQVCTYQRLTELHIEDNPICSLDNIKDGDCVVCFSKNDVYTVSRDKFANDAC